ncbi:MAG: hypothetical protein HOJ34_08870 [Kordiimonadaceae bacterium]|jgi:ABC-2 type transport system permease protein|nr:hypothetical protein [Kordiimonadaceae bacterium]MBT6033577.1 hypothetical protein [Kordiimonadaceae bacterium]MBT6329880.1 hypothetical protein [Kordiimonadaceae bacterium]MBT7582371.1 hypothetical protein [Kordiimonadaceae bacterium]
MFSNLTAINGYNPIKALFLKEFWDNKRAIFTTPMVITGLFIFFAIVAMINGSGMMFDGVSMNDHLSNNTEFDEKSSAIMTGILMVSPMVLMISVGFSMVFTALSVLFDERKDKSILFWKSMPVSDTQEVLVKLATVVVVTPVIAIGFALIIQFFTTFMLGAIVSINTDYSAWDLVFTNINYLAVIIGDIVPVFVIILWTLPIFTYFMLVSSFSRRSPFLLAFIIPVLGVVIEKIFFDSEQILRVIASRFTYLEKYGDRYDIDDGGNMIEAVTGLLGSLGEPSLWIGIIVAAAMIAGSIQIRKRNSIT